MPFNEGGEELVEVLPASPASDVLMVRRCGDPATGAEPASTPIEGHCPSVTGSGDEHFAETVMQVPAEGHVAGDAGERPVHEVHPLAALGAEHERMIDEGISEWPRLRDCLRDCVIERAPEPRWRYISPVPKPSILATLSVIQARPSMHLGWDANARRAQLFALEAVITGYSLALHQHRIGEDDLAVIDELEEFLRKQSGADNLRGIDQILATSPTEADAWGRVWALIDEFRQRKGHVA